MKLGLEDIISLLVDNVNALGVKDVSIALEGHKDAYAFRIKAHNASIASGSLEGVRVDDLDIKVNDIKLGLTPKQMLEQAQIRVDRLVVQANADLINSLLTSPTVLAELKRNAPVEIRGLRLVFDDEIVTIRGEVRKIISFPFSIELRFSPTADNGLKIVFENFWAADMLPLPGKIRRLIMSFAQQKLGGIESLRGVVSITDDYITINPWSKIPLNLDAKFTRFGVKGKHFVLELGPNAEYNKPATPQVAKQPVAPQVEPTQDGAEEIMPLPSYW